jgi:hypothetical protein
MGAIIVRNLAEALAYIEGLEDKLEKAAQLGVAMAGLRVERDAKINASNGSRTRVGNKISPPKHIGPSGSGPNLSRLEFAKDLELILPMSAQLSFMLAP